MRQVIPDTRPEYDAARVIERPDGFYWQARDGSSEYGPFATLLEAVQDMVLLDADQGAPEPGETLQEAEAEIGMADWIDPETGEPAEEDGAHLEEH